jgi:hypothetical protein
MQPYRQIRVAFLQSVGWDVKNVRFIFQKVVQKICDMSVTKCSVRNKMLVEKTRPQRSESPVRDVMCKEYIAYLTARRSSRHPSIFYQHYIPNGIIRNEYILGNCHIFYTPPCGVQSFNYARLFPRGYCRHCATTK